MPLTFPKILKIEKQTDHDKHDNGCQGDQEKKGLSQSVFSDQVKTLSDQAWSHTSGLGFLWQMGKDGAIRFDLTLYPKVKFSVGTAWKF